MDRFKRILEADGDAVMHFAMVLSVNTFKQNTWEQRSLADVMRLIEKKEGFDFMERATKKAKSVSIFAQVFESTSGEIEKYYLKLVTSLVKQSTRTERWDLAVWNVTTDSEVSTAWGPVSSQIGLGEKVKKTLRNKLLENLDVI